MATSHLGENALFLGIGKVANQDLKLHHGHARLQAGGLPEAVTPVVSTEFPMVSR